MPPSPALRYSPGREPKADNHKRGRSLEGGLRCKDKDDDLALFNEMQSKERDDFLLQSSDDFEDTFSTKLKHFSDFKLGISIPDRGESSELLNADGDKNDYDWLLTPPDTPLFPSLDDEAEPPPVNVAHRGRPRSQPITISRSSTMEKSYRSSRGSASPNRLSPSPRSTNSTSQSRGRPSSAPHSSPTLTQRPATPQRRSSPPPSRASTSAPRSSTPTPRRTSTGSGERGTSPIRTSQGNSVSPKIRAWQSNIPGFSSEAPPNLRTSLSDRPASYVRGSSPASRNSRDSSSKFGRQSMSPTASRSVSSSHSQDRDRISSHSKGSVASSGDDDVDSLQSIHVGSLDRLASKRIGAYPNNRAVAFSKKSTRIVSPSSAPKRSFDSALRQMDHRRNPQNMFRPLLSSVPSSTFYVGKANSAHRSLISRNSSVTTSSNTSSDQGTSVAHDTEGSDHLQEDIAFEIGTVLVPDVQEEVFAFDKADVLKKDVRQGTDDGSLHFQLSEIDRELAIECKPGDFEEFNHRDVDGEISFVSNNVCIRPNNSAVDSLENTKVCFKCGCKYRVTETLSKDTDICPDCNREDILAFDASQETILGTADNLQKLSTRISEERKPYDEPESLIQSQVNDLIEEGTSNHEDDVKQNQTSHHGQNQFYSEGSYLSKTLLEGGEQRIASHQGSEQLTVGYNVLDNDTGNEKLLHSNKHQSLKVDVSEGAGISVLLTRSSSNKGPVVQGKTFIASTITYNELSYARNSTNSLRSSIGHGSTSASSSFDFSSDRQVETRVQRQLSGKKSDMENCRYDTNLRSHSTGSSLSGTVNDAHQVLGLATSRHEENMEEFVGTLKYNGMEEICVASHRERLAIEIKEKDVSDTPFSSMAAPVQDLLEQHENSRIADASTSDLSSHTVGSQLEENLSTSTLSYENGEDFSKNTRSVLDEGSSANPPEPSVEVENTVLHAGPDRVNVADVSAHRRLASISEIETQNCCESTHGSEKDDMLINEFQNPSVPTSSDKDTSSSALKCDTSDHVHGILEGSTVMVECQGRSKTRSLTLEEATDAILFCSSIVHNLAYQAATIAFERENSVPLEGSWPTVTILGNSTTDRKDPPRGKTAGKHNSKSQQKVRQRRVETDVEHPASKTENDENAHESTVRNVGLPDKMDSMKPLKLESKCNCTIM